MKRKIILLFIILFAQIINIQVFGNQIQQKDSLKPVIQFSGVVITGDSLKPIPFASIRIDNSHYSMIANYEGFFSFVARPGAVVTFTSIGFKPSKFKIPDTLSANKYSWFQMMQTDTILLKETVIYAWANVEQLEKAIVEFKVPEGDYERAMKNLERENLKEMAIQLPMNGSMNYRQGMQNMVNKNYYNGQYAPITLLNPIAWAKFFEAWKNGDFKIER